MRREKVSHVTVSGGWRDNDNGVKCHGFCFFLAFGGEGKRCHMLRFLRFGGEGKRCHMLRFLGIWEFGKWGI